jgi:tetratricopeptide (TPR) repeat protein
MPSRAIQIDGEVLGELPSNAALHVYRTLRFLELWSVADGSPDTGAAELLAGEALNGLVMKIEQSPGIDEAIMFPLIAIVCELGSAQPNLAHMELACMAATDWAIQNGARRTALAFAEAAAYVARNPRYVFLAGKLHRQVGRVKDAESWLRRASQLATRVKDWETRTRSDEALGVAYLNGGRYSEAKTRFKLALNVATRRRVKPLVGEIYHYLFVVAVATRQFREAEVAARQAAAAYGPDHDRLPHFAHDLAVYALDRDDCASAASVLTVLLRQRHWQEDLPNLLLAHGSTLRALGACGNAAEFNAVHREFELLIERVPEGVTHAQAFLAAGLGALGLDRRSDARRLFQEARTSAERTQQPDLVVRAEQLMAEARNWSHASVTAKPGVRPPFGNVARMTVRALIGQEA